MPIQVLAPELANQIAAGEVVERPASVVKELIENSLDAGAREVRVEVRDGGRRLIRVQDDGSGIADVDTAVLFQRHATSKISSAADLDRITTLGFRGEALASIGSVAQVTLLTRSAQDAAGTLVRMAPGQTLSREPRGTPQGTTITVEHLFANIPARLKFLKQPATESGHILQVITRYALAYPALRLSLVSDGKLLFQSTGSGKLYDVLVKVYGLEVAREMLAIEPPGGQAGDDEDLPLDPRPLGRALRVGGYIGAPSLHRSTRSYITLFVNRRWFADSSLAYGIIQAYHTLLPVGRYPVAVLFIEIDPSEVDVNVHPAKAEVRFRDGRAVFGSVQRTVRRTLTEQAPIPQVSLGYPAATAGVQAGNALDPQLSWEQMSAWSTRRDALLAAGTARASPHAGSAQAVSGPAPLGEHAALAAAPETPLMPLLRVVGQLASTYLVAEGPDGMYLIDQHAAHERILYEAMVASHAGQGLVTQPLLEPVVLNLSPEGARAASEALPLLNEWGVAIEAFGGGSYLVRSVPAILAAQDPQSAVAEVIDGLTQGIEAVEGAREAQLVTLICKRAAVKGGQTLSMAEMQELVHRLEGCRAPRTCPHGRPTMIHVSASELARLFGRT